MKTITLDAGVLEAIAGHYDEALRLIEDRFHVRLAARGSDITVTAIDQSNGAEAREARVTALLRQLGELHDQGVSLAREDLKTAVGLIERQPAARLKEHFVEGRITTPTKAIYPRSANQRGYIQAMRDADLVLGIGPAGTRSPCCCATIPGSPLSARSESTPKAGCAASRHASIWAAKRPPASIPG